MRLNDVDRVRASLAMARQALEQAAEDCRAIAAGEEGMACLRWQWVGADAQKALTHVGHAEEDLGVRRKHG